MAMEEDVYSTVFSVLKHPIRRRVMRMLNSKPQTYTEILKALNVETGYLNYHLESMRDLVTKDEHGRYSLSVFGEAAVNLLAKVEEPIKREKKATIMGFKLTATRLLTLAVMVLTIFNVYLFASYQGLYSDKANALGEVMMQTRGLLSDANSVLNHTVKDRRIDFETWAVLLRDMSLQLRLYNTISALDPNHRQLWIQIRSAIDEATSLFYAIDQGYGQSGGRYLNLTDSQTSSLETLLEGLVIIEEKAFPKKIVMGANPEISMDETALARAVEAAVNSQAKVQSVRIGFGLRDLWNPEGSIDWLRIRIRP
jgi:hypothetical protein